MDEVLWYFQRLPVIQALVLLSKAISQQLKQRLFKMPDTEQISPPAAPTAINKVVNRQNMSSTAYLRKKDTAFNLSGIEGVLVLSGKNITFTPKSEEKSITMAIDNIAEADLTNIMAKDQIIFTTKDSNEYIITFFPPGSPKVDKRVARSLFIPGGFAYWNISRLSKYSQISQQWEKALISVLPATTIKQRVEVHIVRTLVVTLLICLILLGLLAAVIAFSSQESSKVVH
jgi:hypothetical protein